MRNVLLLRGWPFVLAYLRSYFAEGLSLSIRGFRQQTMPQQLLLIRVVEIKSQLLFLDEAYESVNFDCYSTKPSLSQIITISTPCNVLKVSGTDGHSTHWWPLGDEFHSRTLLNLPLELVRSTSQFSQKYFTCSFHFNFPIIISKSYFGYLEP